MEENVVVVEEEDIDQLEELWLDEGCCETPDYLGEWLAYLEQEYQMHLEVDRAQSSHSDWRWA